MLPTLLCCTEISTDGGEWQTDVWKCPHPDDALFRYMKNPGVAVTLEARTANRYVFLRTIISRCFSHIFSLQINANYEII